MVGGVLSKNGGANSNQAHLGPPEDSFQKAVASGGSNPARLGELGGKLLPYFPINKGRGEGKKCSALLVIRDHLKLEKKIVSVKKI